MLQRDCNTLRMRVKAMQETIDHLNTRVTQLLTNEVGALLTKSGERRETSPFDWDWMNQKYLNYMTY